MTLFIVVGLAISAVALWWLVRPLWRAGRSERWQVFAWALVFVVIVAGGYAWVGSPAHLRVTARQQVEPAVPTAPSASAALADLEAQARARPQDGRAQAAMGRAYAVVGRYQEAAEALRRANTLQPDDPSLLADFAYALAMANGRNLQGEPRAIIERALAIDPTASKALGLAGTAAFDRRDYSVAIAYWERLATGQPPDSPIAQQLQVSIAEARKRGGVAASAASSAASAAMLRGRVALSPRWTSRVSPADTLFIFARAVDGPPLPLAVLRRSVRDLPLSFEFDDTMAMTPQAKLSAFSQVVVSARVSKSGNATPQPGDLVGRSGPVGSSSQSVMFEIDEEVQAPAKQ